jgi:coatomer subunit beta'
MESGAVKVFRNFQEHKAFKTNYSNEGIFGGKLLGIKSKEFISFYEWENFSIVRRIDVAVPPKNIYWSDTGNQFVMSLEDSFYLLHYNEDTVIQNLPGLSPDDEDGLEEAFTFLDEFNDPI